MDPKLYRAAKEGNIDVLNHLSQLEVQVTPNENTALHIAAEFGNRLCVKAILQICPSLLCRTNAKRETALHLAAKEGYTAIVRALIRRAVGQTAKDMVRMKNENDDTALHEAVRYRHLDVVKLLLKVDVEFSYPPNKQCETPVYLAAEKRLHMILYEILNTCKSSSPCGPDGRTALHAAVTSADDDESWPCFVRRILRYEDITPKPRSNISSTECIKMLLEWKPNLSREADANGWTPLHYAAHINSVEGASQLLAWDGDTYRSSSSSSQSIAYLITSEKDGKNTALHFAARRGNVLVMELLLSHRPDCFEMVNGKGQNIIHIAVENKRECEVIRFLERKNRGYLDILVNRKDKNGDIPLHLLAASGRVVRQLVFHPRVEKMVFNEKSMTPMEICRTNMANGEFEQISWQHIKRILCFFTHDVVKIFGPTGRRNVIRQYEEIMKRREIRDEEEMKELENARDTNLIVAVLIATVTFAAGFTLPGGYDNDSKNGTNQGLAVLSTKASFKAFIITNSIALVLSSISVFLYFLTSVKKTMVKGGSLHSRNTYRLANVLIVFAQEAMVMAFFTGLYCVLPHFSSVAVSICVVGSVFFSIFLILQNWIFLAVQ